VLSLYKKLAIRHYVAVTTEDFDYKKKDLDFLFSCEDIVREGEEYSVVIEDGYSITVPDSYAIKSSDKGINYEVMQIGRTNDKKWVLTKPGDLHLGNSAPAHLTYQAISKQLEFNHPGISYDKENDLIILEHLGRLKNPLTFLNEYNDFEKEIINGMAVKALAGDADIGNNIGFKESKCFIYDFEKAGDIISSVEKSFVRYIELLNEGTATQIEMEQLDTKITEMAWEVDKAQLKKEIKQIEQECGLDSNNCLSFQPNNIVYNVERARNEEVFDYEYDSILDLEDVFESTEEEINDKKSISELMNA